MADRRIELLFWAGCPSHPEALELLRGVLDERGIDAEIDVHEVLTDAEAEQLRFPGSPTIRIAGRDIDPEGADGPAGAHLPCLLAARRAAVTRPEPPTAGGSPAMSLTLAERAPSFALRGIDGREHTLAGYADADVLVLVQSCNHCPYVLAWEGRLIDLQERLPRPRGAVCRVQLERREPLPGRLVRGDGGARPRASGFTFDYLHDPEQSLARALGSERTPEVFVFDRDRRLVYHGAIDDNRDETAVGRRYLGDALDAVLAGEPPPIAETPPVGCTVKWLP